MEEQLKQSIGALIQAAEVACTRGAFSLSEAGQISMAVAVAQQIFKEEKTAPIAEPAGESKEAK